MGSTDLIQLIDLSLGTEPSGVVNFNYLHALMHAIVKRLGVVEEMRPSGVGVGVSLGVGGAVQTTDVGEDLDGGGEGDGGGGGGGGGGGEGGGGGGGGGGEKGVSGIPSGASDRGKVEGREGEGAGQARKGASPTSSPSPPPPTSGADSKPPSSSGLRRQDGGSASRFQKSRSSVVTAANDLGALERKLQELESRLNAMDTLPELLERKSSDMGATPIRDRWNYTNLSKRLSAAEDSLDQSSKLVDDLLGEVQSLKSTVASCEDSLSQMGDKLSGDVSGMAEKMKALEDLKLLAAKDSMGDAATALLTELQGKMDSLQTELGSVKQAVDTLDLSPYVTSSDLQAALLQQTEKSLQSSTEALAAMDRRVDSLDGELGKLTEQIQELQSTKVNTADLASLMPKGDSGEAASLLPKIVELQGKLQQIEGELGKQPSLPPDVLDQIAAMQKAIDKLTAELASLSAQSSSGSDERSRLEELGSEVAQLRERLSELDRAVTALSNAVSASRTSPGPPAEEEGAKYVDIDSFTALQQLLSQQQQEQERLIGTAAHLSNELEINKEHVKSLYSSVDDLRANKADREEVEVEVREKADRTALEGKASRDWVDSTFERLDQQIREARDKLVGQEEALRSAVTQLNEDVETKLDRLELEPLKEYFDKKLARVKTAPAVVEKEEAMADDAAGFRKPLRFRCISCDKPLGVKPHDAIPALPSISSMPGTRSFRPYTTYELELIRRHQRMGLPVFGPVMEFSRGARSAGGSHTMTNPRRRIRVAPLSSAYSPDSYATPSRSSAHDEVEIVGQDGHIYKGRMSTRKLPPIKDQLRRGKTRSYGTPYSYQQ